MNEELGNNLLDLVRSKGFYPCEYVSDFKKFKEELPSTENFCSSLTVKEISNKEYEHVLIVSNAFQMKTMNYYQDLYLRCVVYGQLVFLRYLEIVA